MANAHYKGLNKRRSKGKWYVSTRNGISLLKGFEGLHAGRFDKEDKELWVKGYVYQDGELNKQFIAFRHGYSVGRSAYLNA